jgi:hypothetical protein
MLTEPLAVTLLVIEALEKLGVLKVQAGRLDMDYLHRWAAELAVGDLLQCAIKESE